MTTIKLKNGSGAPTAGDLVQGEPALDLTNKRLYTEDSGGTVIEVGTNPGTDVTFADNRKALFGSGSDLQIYHDGSNSYIDDAGTGNLFVRADSLQLRRADGSQLYLAANTGAEVGLYHAGNAKLATTSTGIDVTGTVVSDGLTVSNAGANADITLTEGSTNTDARIRNSNGILQIGTDINDEFGASEIQLSVDGKEFLTVDRFGDISFYEDTGTTAKLFWDASAESLGIGTSSPTNLITVNSTAGAGIKVYGADQAFSRIAIDNLNGQEWNLVAGTAGVSNSGFGIYDVDAGATRLQIDSSGNVGIGVTPTAKLHVAGTIQSQSGSTVAQMYSDGGAAYFSSVGAYPSVFLTNGAERMRIDSSGNVGIGASPDTHLHVQGSSGEIRVQDTGSGGGIISFRDSGTSSIPSIQSSGNNLLVNTGGSERLRIDSSGNVGIGSNDAASYGKFLVNGTGNLINANASSGAATFQLYEAGSGRFGITTLDGSAGAKFTTAGTERMRIDSSGNLLVGTTDTFVADNSSGNGLSYRASAGDLGVAATNTPAFYANRMSSDGAIAEFRKDGSTVGSIGTVSGLLGIGSGDAILAFDGSGNAMYPMSSQTGGASDGVLDFGSSLRRFKDLYLSGGATSGTSSNFLRFLHDGSNGIIDNTAGYLVFRRSGFAESMRLDASGNLLVGTSSIAITDEGLKVFSNGVLYGVVDNTQTNALWNKEGYTSGTTYFMDFRLNSVVKGSISSDGTSTAYNTSSDQRLKENIVDAPSASDDIDAIQVRSFDWKADGSHQKYGMVAQELQSVAPEAVTGDADSDEMMGVDYSKLVPMLVKEIQSLRARVAQLEGAN